MIPSAALAVSAVSAFADNYIWLLERGRSAAVVDPGDAAPVRRALAERRLQLAAILITHHHRDHVGGATSLRDEFRVPVYGPRAEAGTIAALTDPLADGDRIRVPGIEQEFEVHAIPGHTLGHIAFVSRDPALLFCGDTLFSAGCGRLFEGTPEQMHRSLSRLAALPGATAVYCGHEYTQANLAFAATVEPENAGVHDAARRIARLRALGQPSLPSSIAHEQQVNPFLRCSEPGVAHSAARHACRALGSPVEVFAALRRWKDDFRAPAPR